MKLLASLSRKTAAPRYSSGLLSLFIMFWDPQKPSRSGCVLNNSVTMVVLVYPGERVFTRILCSAHSIAKLRPNCKTPALDALYAAEMSS